MKLATKMICALALVALAGGVAVAADDVTMEGSFIWARSDGDIDGALKAVFTPTGKNEYDVSFHFEWEGEQKVWSGTAKGDLNSGDLKGDIKTDNPDRDDVFSFMGSVADGKFTGKHGGMRDGELNEMGTLELSAK